MDTVKTSRYLSLILRHAPERAGITLDASGWVDVRVLLDACAAHGHPINRAELDEIVVTNPKKRFAVSEDGLKIRASQGHSVSVDLGLDPREPPNELFHGTATSNLDSIMKGGLTKMARQHVHLSAEEATALNVGSRHGKPIVLRVAAERMHADGIPFFMSANGVWLVDHVPQQYLMLAGRVGSSP